MTITKLFASVLVGTSIFAASSVSPALANGQNNALLMQMMAQQQAAAQAQQVAQVPLNQRPEVLADPTFNPLANPRVNPQTAAQYGNYFDPTSPAGYVKGPPNQLPTYGYGYGNPYMNNYGYPNPYASAPYMINSYTHVKRWKHHHR